MKHMLHVLPLLFAASMTNAQLMNGSFEIDGQPSLEGWNNSCGEAISLPGGAPGSGNWHVGYPMNVLTESGNCNNSFDVLFQEMPWLIPANQTVTVGFWTRTTLEPSSEIFIAVECRLGHVNTDGWFAPQVNTGGAVAPSTEWAYHTVQGTINGWQPAQPRAIGFAGYDTSGTEIMELDGIEILAIEEMSTASAAIDPEKVLGYFDPSTGEIVSTRNLGQRLLCFDAAGRSVELPMLPQMNGSTRYATSFLSTGLYSAVAGTRILRFVKP